MGASNGFPSKQSALCPTPRDTSTILAYNYIIVRQGNLQVVKKDSHDLLSPKIKQVIEDIFITIRKPEGIRETPEFVSMYFCLGALF